MARWPWSSSACVTRPDGLVKSSSQAPGAPRRRVSAAMSSTTGTVRSALAKPPGPVVSWPMQPNCRGMVSSRRRAAMPPTRSWTSTNEASRKAVARSVVVVKRPLKPWWRRMRPARPPTIARRVGVDVVEHELVDRQHLAAQPDAFDELGRVGAAAADDRDLDAHQHPPYLPFAPAAVPAAVRATTDGPLRRGGRSRAAAACSATDISPRPILR